MQPLNKRSRVMVDENSNGAPTTSINPDLQFVSEMEFISCAGIPTHAQLAEQYKSLKSKRMLSHNHVRSLEHSDKHAQVDSSDPDLDRDDSESGSQASDSSSNSEDCEVVTFDTSSPAPSDNGYSSHGAGSEAAPESQTSGSQGNPQFPSTENIQTMTSSNNNLNQPVRRKWTKDEDDRLRVAVSKLGHIRKLQHKGSITFAGTFSKSAPDAAASGSSSCPKGNVNESQDTDDPHHTDEGHWRNWKAIAKFVGTRDSVQCLQRWQKILKPGLKKGQWSEEEDKRLIELKAIGFKNWGKLAVHMEGRTSKQCRERWCHHLDPRVKKVEFSPEEDAQLISMQAALGNQWAIIAKQMEGRTENSIRARFKALNNPRSKARDSACHIAAVASKAHSSGSGRIFETASYSSSQKGPSQGDPRTPAGSSAESTSSDSTPADDSHDQNIATVSKSASMDTYEMGAYSKPMLHARPTASLGESPTRRPRRSISPEAHHGATSEQSTFDTLLQAISSIDNASRMGNSTVGSAFVVPVGQYGYFPSSSFINSHLYGSHFPPFVQVAPGPLPTFFHPTNNPWLLTPAQAAQHVATTSLLHAASIAQLDRIRGGDHQAVNNSAALFTALTQAAGAEYCQMGDHGDTRADLSTSKVSHCDHNLNQNKRS